jgi:hypothetical protein
MGSYSQLELGIGMNEFRHEDIHAATSICHLFCMLDKRKFGE